MIRIRQSPLDEVFLQPVGKSGKLSEHAAMALAISTAYGGIGHVSPNPLVGAVLVNKRQQFVERACHQNYGDLHAEANLIRLLTDTDRLHELQDGTMYVTLEPCSHQGKTPSCAKMLAKFPLEKIVFGIKDPNPIVNGSGVTILQQSNLATEQTNLFKYELLELMDTYLWSITKKTPFVALKAAISCDGAIARHGDQKKWLTSERARQYGHFLRLKYDAIAIGKNTLLMDNPHLTVRHRHFSEKVPWRIIFDSSLNSLDQLKLKEMNILKEQPEKIIWIISDKLDQQHKVNALRDYNVKIIKASLNRQGTIDLPILLTKLWNLGIHSILLEGGRSIYSSFLAAGVVQKIHVFMNGQILGGSQRLNWLEQLDKNVDLKLNDINITILDDDLLYEGSLYEPSTPS